VRPHGSGDMYRLDQQQGTGPGDTSSTAVINGIIMVAEKSPHSYVYCVLREGGLCLCLSLRAAALHRAMGVCGVVVDF
jgi:hypothetical protein